MTRYALLLITTLLLSVQGLAQRRAMFRGDQVVHLTQLSSPLFEAKPSISDDKLTLFYASGQPGGVGDLDLWQAIRPDLNSPFGAGTNITPLNSPFRDHTPTTSADGLLVIFSSNRPGGIGIDDAWMSTRASQAAPWSPPVHVPGLNSPLRDMGFSMTPDGLELYFTSNRPGLGNFDLYHSSRPDLASAWSPPVPIVELNTPYAEKFPSVTGDNLTLYFASERPGSVSAANGGASLDIWVAMRPDTISPWTVIENVYELNTEYGEYLMSVANDDSEMFFVSDRPSTLGSFDLYEAKAIPEAFRYGVGITGAAGVPRIKPVGGIPSPGNQNWGYEITNVSPTAFGFYVVGLGAGGFPFLVDLTTISINLFQFPNFFNPPPEVPRFIPNPIPAAPQLVGLTNYCQVFMVWDLSGLGNLNGIPYASSPGLQRTVVQ